MPGWCAYSWFICSLVSSRGMDHAFRSAPTMTRQMINLTQTTVVARRKHLTNSSGRRITRRHLLRPWLPYNRGQITHYLERRTFQPDALHLYIRIYATHSPLHPLFVLLSKAPISRQISQLQLGCPQMDQGMKRGSLGNVIGHMNNLGWLIGRAAIAADPIRGRCTPSPVTLTAAL
jgi:hypothetical protein